MSQNEKAISYEQIFDVCLQSHLAGDPLSRFHDPALRFSPTDVFYAALSRADFAFSRSDEWYAVRYRNLDFIVADLGCSPPPDNASAHALVKQYYAKCVPNDLWMAREAVRGADSRRENRAAVWAEEIYCLLDTHSLTTAPHFVRRSKEQPELWIYTVSPEHGRQDRQTQIKLGKLLGKLIPSMDAERIKKYATWFGGGLAGLELQILRTEEEIVEAYNIGPSSCMSGDTSVAAYASEDLALAVVSNFDGTRFSSRAVLNMKDKQYSRIYGSVERLKPLLEAAGYTRGSLEGCRLKTLDSPHGGYKMPWLDHPFSGLVPPSSSNGSEGPFWWVRDKFLVGSTNFDFEEEPKVITICHAGAYQGGTQSGCWHRGHDVNRHRGSSVDDLWGERDDLNEQEVDECDTEYCAHCETDCNPDDMASVEGMGSDICQDCRDCDDNCVEGIVDSYGDTGWMIRDVCNVIEIRYPNDRLSRTEYLLDGVELRNYLYVEREDCYFHRDYVCGVARGDTELIDDCTYSDYHNSYVYNDDVVWAGGKEGGLAVWSGCDELVELTLPSLCAGKFALDAEEVVDEYRAVEVAPDVWILASEVEDYESGALFRAAPARFGDTPELELTEPAPVAYSEFEIEDEDDVTDTAVSKPVLEAPIESHA